jgi:hypothetical protein
MNAVAVKPMYSFKCTLTVYVECTCMLNVDVLPWRLRSALAVPSPITLCDLIEGDPWMILPSSRMIFA